MGKRRDAGGERLSRGEARQVVEALRPRWPKGNADRWR